MTLINCDLEQIQGLVYQISKDKNNDDNIIIEKVLSKISPLLSQDIILPLKYNDNFEYKDLIFKYYFESEHSNLENFLKTIQKKKNIIYTFSKIFDTFNNLINIKNEILNFEINNSDNIKIIKIINLKSEKELENNIDNYLNEEKYKICIIQFTTEESKFINYIKFFIENKEKECYSKIFIFIIHIERIISYNKKDKEQLDKKILKETISNLSDYYQIFIDNLNGDEQYSLKKFHGLTNNEAIKKLLNMNQSLEDKINMSINYFKYNISFSIGELNKNKYFNLLKQYINNNNKINDLINTNFDNNFFNEYDSIEKLLFKTQKEDNENNYLIISENDIDMLSILKKYLFIEYQKQLKSYYFTLEENSFFSSMLSINQEELIIKKNGQKDGTFNSKKDIIEKIYLILLERFSQVFKNIKISEKLGSNTLNIILGLKIPGIKISITNILNKINRNIIFKFRINEFTLRKEIINGETFDNYWKVVKRYNNLTSMEIKDENLISTIINKLDKDNLPLFYDILLEDFCILFINNNLSFQYKDKINILSLKNMLLFMIKLNNEKFKIEMKDCNDNHLISIANAINWVECYKMEIITILKIYSFLDLKINNLYENIKETKSEYSILKRNGKYIKIVNESILIGIESILGIMISDETFFNNIFNRYSKILDIINIYREILYDVLKIEKNLKLNSEKIFSLQEIVEIFNLYYLNKIDSKEEFKYIINYFCKQTEHINNKDFDELNNEFEHLYKTLSKNVVQKDNNYLNVMAIIFENEFKKGDKEEFRIKLLTIFLEDKLFTPKSSNIIRLSLEDNISHDIKNIQKYFNDIKFSDSKLIQFINEKCDNSILEEILLNYFDNEINLYFNSIKDLKDDEIKDSSDIYIENKEKQQSECLFLFKQPMEIFQESITILDSILEDDKIPNLNLCKLYSISFIKIYISKLAYYFKNSYQQMKSLNEIFNFDIIYLKDISLYYFYKELFNLFDNYEDFINNEHLSGYQYDFKFMNEDNNNEMLLYYFLPVANENYKKEYDTQNKIFQNCNKNKNYQEYLSLFNNKDKYNLDIFIMIITNNIISNLGLNNYVNIEEYKNFSNDFQKNNIFNEKLNKLLSLYCNENNFKNILMPKLLYKEKIDQHLFVILLYGFRFCVKSLYINKNNLYTFLFDKNCLLNLKENYIPGNNEREDLHLHTILDINNHFQNYPSDKGCYICSCGYYYSIESCGFPNKYQSSRCPKCKMEIGFGKNEKLKKNQEFCINPRKGHYRIFKNKEDKENEMNKYKITNEMIPNKTMEEYMTQIIEPLINEEKPGLNIVTKNLFLSLYRKYRNISKISYRLLNFIIYNYLFFSNCLGYISDEDLKNNCLIENMSCLEIIESDWNLLKEALQEKSINSIEIFMNIIFLKLSDSLNIDKSLKTIKERDLLEDEVEAIVKESINNYKNYKELYLEDNLNLLKLKKDNIKVVVNEMISPDKYSEDKFPYYKYFMYTKYPNKNDFTKEFDKIGEIYKYKYPLLNQIISNESQLKKIKYLNDINEFCNYMIDYYSFKISREKANETSLKDIEFKDFTNEQLTKFCNAWKEIYKYAEDYKGNKINQKELSDNDKLIYFLNDNKDMHIAAVYQLFISWQNTFLQNIYNANAYNGILHFYVYNLKNRIPIQEAKQSQILSFDDVNLGEIISRHWKRDNFNNIIYDFDLIEKELGELILPEKCLFDENKLRFVSFWFENNTNIFTTFSEKYHQEELTEEQKEKIKSFFKDIKDKHKMLTSFHYLINYFNNYEHDDKEIINKILEKESEYIKIDENINNFFKEEIQEKFNVNQLVNVYLYFEEIFFEEIKKEKFNNNKIFEKIENEKIYNIKNIIKEISNKIDLLNALKRYVLRYLIDEHYLIKNSNNNISLELERQELWNVDENKLNEIKNILNKEIKNFDIKVKEVFLIYELIKK